MRVVIAGGGTGGHLFPGIAMAHQFKDDDPSSQVLFIGTKKGIESRAVPKEGFPIAYIDISGIKGKSPVKVMVALIKLPLSVVQSIQHLIRFRPDIVIGVGGYSSGPVCLSAFLLGIPVVIHEQNMFPGLTTSILGKMAKVILVSFSGTAKSFPGRDVRYVGNPIRRDIRLKEGVNGREKNGSFTIFIFGGSQGAHTLNRGVVDGFPYLEEIKDRLHFIHQTGEKDFVYIKSAYEKNGFSGEVSPFIDDMADAYSRADLVISRSGGSALAEIMAMGKPSILIPFPYATENHQYYNALEVANGGGAKIILDADVSGEFMAYTIKEFMADRKGLLEMGLASKRLGKPRAAEKIVNICKGLV